MLLDIARWLSIRFAVSSRPGGGSGWESISRTLRDPCPVYFVKVANLSPGPDVGITHVWFATDPSVHALLPERRLPKRLRPDQQWEGWVETAKLAGVADVEHLGRARLSNVKVVKSRRDSDLPDRGFVARP